MRPFLNIPHDSIRFPALNKLEPHDAYHETGWKRLVDRYETRLESNALKKMSKLHVSIQQVRERIQRTPKSCSHSLLSLRDLKWDFTRCLVTWNGVELAHTRESVCLFSLQFGCPRIILFISIDQNKAPGASRSTPRTTFSIPRAGVVTSRTPVPPKPFSGRFRSTCFSTSSAPQFSASRYAATLCYVHFEPPTMAS